MTSVETTLGARDSGAQGLIRGKSGPESRRVRDSNTRDTSRSRKPPQCQKQVTLRQQRDRFLQENMMNLIMHSSEFIEEP